MRNSHNLGRFSSTKHAGFHARTIALIILALIGNWGCGAGGGQPGNNNPPPPPPNDAPVITSVSPDGAVAGSGAFTLTVNGVNFVAASMVNFGGSAPATTFVTSTELTATIAATSVASTGTMSVTVTNPASEGGTSVPFSFSITGGTNPVPTINVLFPSCAPAGVQLVDSVNNLLTVISDKESNNFVAGSVVRWNGTDRPTASNGTVNALVAQISASDIAAAGTATVTVFNPPPGGGTSNSLTFTITPGAVSPGGIAVDPAGKFAYVANSGCGGGVGGYVSMYTINPTTGALASIGPPVPTNDEFTDSVSVDPSGKFAYVVSSGDVYDIDFGSILAFNINPSTGALTPATGGIFGTGVNGTPEFFNSVALDPSGKFAFAADGGAFPPGSFGGSSSFSMYTINATTGALTSTGTTAAGSGPDSVAVDPTGEFAYVANFGSNNISMYTINARTGALTSIGMIPAGPGPDAVAVDPSGKFAYATNWTGYGTEGSVSMYSINPMTGALTAIGTIAAGASPISIAVDPSGKFAYVVNFTGNQTDGSVSMYTINATTGDLTPIGTIATDQSPASITIHPSGKFAYVTNSSSNNVCIYSIDTTTGDLTLVGTIGT